MDIPSRTNPTGAATTIAMLAIPMDPAAAAPPTAIVSTMDNAIYILLYFLYVFSRLFLSTEIFFLHIVDFL